MSTSAPQPPEEFPNQPPSTQAGQPYVVRNRFAIRLSKPYVTRTLIVLNVLVFVAMVVYGYMTYNTLRGTEDMRVLVDFGAKVNSLIADGETWRLFSAMFIHIGVFHLLVNLYALYILGPLVEGYFGHLRFLGIYLVGGLFGSLASYAFSDSISAGASGAIFGLAGAITVFFLRYRDNFGKQGRSILQSMAFIIGLNLIFGLTVPGIDNWGHIGGLVGGAVVAYGLLPRYKAPDLLQPGPQVIEQEERVIHSLLWVSVCVAVLVFAVEFVTRSVHGG
ncbi:MAG: rhomboid family intramembrane serine protease [Caldilineaceae bacterium]